MPPVRATGLNGAAASHLASPVQAAGLNHGAGASNHSPAGATGLTAAQPCPAHVGIRTCSGLIRQSVAGGQLTTWISGDLMLHS